MKSRFFIASKRFKKQLAKRNRALWIGSTVICFSMVPLQVDADTPGVENPPGTQTFTTDQSDGVNVTSSSIFTLNVRDLNGAINPGDTMTGINFRSNNAGDLTLNAGLTGPQVTINTTNATGVSVVSVGSPPAPVSDTFLGIPVPTSQQVQGGAVTVNNGSSINTAGNASHGIRAQSSTTGYPASVSSALQNFVGTNKAAGFTFTVKDVVNANGTDSAVGSAVTASRTDAAGNPVAGAAGSFVFQANGTYALTPGTAFDDLAVGQSRVVRVSLSVTGKNPSNVTKDDTGFILIRVTKTSGGFVPTTVASGFAEFGASATVFPDLTGYVNRLLSSGSGGAGNSVNVHNTDSGNIQTVGVGSHGVLATSQGGNGGDGRDASVTDSSTQGGNGSTGGDVTVTADGNISTTGNQSAGVVAWSTGGNGGTGGDSGYTRNAKAGGSGATGGDVLVEGSGTIRTNGLQASGILAVSQGGSGGGGGDGSTFNGADAGGRGGLGGNVEVHGDWNITTLQNQSHAIWAKSTGGVAGGGGDGGWTGTSAGSGGNATDGGNVLVYSGNTLITQGNDSYGIYAESIGGFGGGGGDGTSIFYASGGNGASAGSGGNVGVTQAATGQILTIGERSHGIFAQSVGGGGGSGGGGGALVGLGGGGETGGNGGTVDVNNAGRITTTGAGARGIYAQSVGGGGGDGGDAGGLVAVGGKGSATSDGKAVKVINTGAISTTSSSIFAQSIGGGGGSGGSSVGWFSFGGAAGSGGNAGDVSVSSKGNLTTTEANASAIFAQSVGGGGGNGGNSTAVGAIVSLALGGAGGQAGNAGAVNVGVNPANGSIDPVTGIITTNGDYSRGIQAQSVGGGGGNGGFAASIALNPSGGSVAIGLGGSGAGGGDAGAVGVYAGNAATQITTDGKDAHGIFAQSVGGGGGSGGFSVAASAGVGFSAAVSLGGKAGGGGDGGVVNVGNATNQILGTITTNDVHSYGIFAQSVGGGGGDGGYSVAGAVASGMSGSLSFGGEGGTGGVGKDVNLYSGAIVTTKLADSHGIFAQSIGGGGGSGGFSVAGSLGGAAVNLSFGGSGATGGPAGNVVLHSTGSQVTTSGSHSFGIIAQSIGGGGGDGGFSVTGGITAGPSLGFSMGGSGATGNIGRDVTLSSSSNVTTNGEDSHAIVAQSVGGGGGSGGFSVAASISIDPTGGGAGAAVNASIGGKAGGGGDAGNVVLTSSGAEIKTHKTHSYGLLAQSIGGGGGDGGFSVAGSISTGPAVSFSMGGAGGAGGAAGTVLLDSSSNITTKGTDSHGIFAQSVGGGGGSGGFSVAGAISTGSAGVSASIGGAGATGGEGKKVTVGNTTAITGNIKTEADNSYAVLAQSIGGGGGNGGFSVAGGITSSAAVNFSLGGEGGGAGIGGNVILNSAARAETLGINSHALFAQSVGGGGGSGGFSVVGGASSSNGALGVSLGGQGAGGGDAGTVTLTSTGSAIITGKDHSNAIHAQSIGGGGGDGGFSIAGGISAKAAVNFSLGGGGGNAGIGKDVTVNNSSSISTSGGDSVGIFAQSVGGGGGSGGFSATGSVSTGGAAIGATIGGSGAGGGKGGVVKVTSTGDLIVTTGDHSDAILAQSVGGGGGNGGFSIGIAGSLAESTAASFSVGGFGGIAGNGDFTQVINSSDLYTYGEVSHGILAQSVGGGGGNGGFSLAGAMSAKSNGFGFSLGGFGGAAGTGGMVEVKNSGYIQTGGPLDPLTLKGSGKGSNGIIAQSIGGGGGNGGFSGAFTATVGSTAGKGMSVSIGGFGGAGGNADTVKLTNSGEILTTADDSTGLFAQSVGGGGGNGGFSLAATLSAAQEKAALSVSIGGYGAGGGDGLTVDVINSNKVTTIGEHSNAIFAQSIGGGGGNGGFSVASSFTGGNESKSVAVSVGGGGGVGGKGDTVTVNNTAALTTFGNDSTALVAQSIGGGGGNGGFSVTGSFAGPESKSLSVAVGGAGGASGTGGDVNLLGGGGLNSIETQGQRSHGILAQSIGGGGGSGGFSAALALGIGGNEPGKSSTSIGVSVGGSGGTGNTGGAVKVGTAADRLTGSVTTLGIDSVGIFAQSVGGGGGDGGFSLTGSVALAAGQQGPNNNLAISVGGGGGSGNHGGAVDVHHTGAVTTSGDSSHGIQAQSIGGGGGDGGSSRAFNLQLGPKPDPTGPGGKPTQEEKDAGSKNKALALAIGGSGSGGGDGGKVVVDHIGNITTDGADAYGIYAQSIGGGGGDGGAAHQGFPNATALKKYDRSKFTKNVKIVVGGSGGSSGNGDTVTVSNTGAITTTGMGSDGVFAQSVGGGGGQGGAGVEGALGTVGIGGGTGTTGDGAAVDVTIKGSVTTWGDSANGITAQSVGGGGGRAGNVDRGLMNYANIGIGLAFGQDAGNGGDGGLVTVNSTADITTHGASSTGIFAQSVGGGGGVAGSLGNDFPLLSVLNFAGSVGGIGSGGIVNVTQVGNIHTSGEASNGIFAQSAGGQDLGKAVTVKVTGNVLADGAESNGIFLQSIGMAGNDDLKVQVVSGTVQGGSNTGSGVRFADGRNNLLDNHGTIEAFDAFVGSSITGGLGNETIDNFGIVRDSVYLGAGTNTFKNQTGAKLESGNAVDLGVGNLFLNSGTISTGGIGTKQTTALTGDFTQSGDAIWIFDLKSDFTSDLFAINGTANLGSHANKVNLNTLNLASTTGTYTLITANSGLTGNFQFGSLTGGSMPVGLTYSLINSDTQEQLKLAESTGPFYWRGGANSVWNGAFVDGASNWTSDAAGNDFIFGTPGVNCDVFFSSTNAATTNRTTTLGADFAVNSLTISDPQAVTIGGTHTLTLAAAGGQGLTVENGAGTAIISSKVKLGASQTWTNNSANLLLVTGSTITGAGRNLTITGTGGTGIDAIIQTGTGSLTKSGTGTLALFQANAYSGGTTLTNGFLQVANNSALGSGSVNLTGGTLVTINDPDKAANTPLNLGVVGDYTQATPATLELRIFGPTGVNDQLLVNGTATLGGTLRPDYSPLGYNPIPPAGNYTDVFHLVHSNTGVTGQFSSFVDVHYNADNLLRWEPVYTAKDVFLEWNQHPFTELLGLTSNQVSTAEVLNKAVGLTVPAMPTPYNESTGPALLASPGLRPAINYLNTRPLAELPRDYDLIAPEEMTALYDAGRAFTQVETANIENRLREIRAGAGSGFSDRGFTMQKKQMSLNPMPTAGKKEAGKEADVFTPGPDNRWGVFISGSAQTLDVGNDGNAAGFDIDTNGVTLGVDYRVNDHFAIGAFHQYTNSAADLVNNGSLKSEGAKAGVYATAHADNGLYVNGLIAAGASSYSSHRLGLNGYASGDTGGWDLDAMLSGGYLTRKGALTFGPLASVTYTSQKINNFTESGSMLPLYYDNQHESSFASRLGFEASYDYKIGGVTLVPQISLAWQHEFLRGAYDVTSSFAQGPGQGFTVSGPSAGRDSLDLRAGVDVLWTQDFGTYVSYQTEIGRTNYQVNSGTIGFHWKF